MVDQMENCLFCSIVAGKIPCHKVYEDSEVLAFLDIYPVHFGHTLIIPKNHYENILDLPEKKAQLVMAAAKKVAKAIMDSKLADGLNLVNSNGRAANQEVMHFHLHVVPRLIGDETGFKWVKKQATAEKLSDSAKKIRENLK